MGINRPDWSHTVLRQRAQTALGRSSLNQNETTVGRRSSKTKIFCLYPEKIRYTRLLRYSFHY